MSEVESSDGPQQQEESPGDEHRDAGLEEAAGGGGLHGHGGPADRIQAGYRLRIPGGSDHRQLETHRGHEVLQVLWSRRGDRYFL
ncbi:hypothetical protein EYF80_027240 [Liparis tanakae]|uniref:Uncharacterized protein n=1 Tax=Liparis tanakae TaxID=230148 RepID=A0A4Z2H9G4_9TELE|nr:hypothetical protein EYF80_027240 [Liparis tanakae]